MPQYVNMDELEVPQLVYILECTPPPETAPYWYVGTSTSLYTDIAKHAARSGPSFTRYNPAIRVHHVMMGDESTVHEVTLQLMLEKGRDNVRGGLWTHVILSRSEVDAIARLLCTVTPKCYKCSGPHVSSECRLVPPRRRRLIYELRNCLRIRSVESVADSAPAIVASASDPLRPASADAPRRRYDFSRLFKRSAPSELSVASAGSSDAISRGVSGLMAGGADDYSPRCERVVRDIHMDGKIRDSAAAAHTAPFSAESSEFSDSSADNEVYQIAETCRRCRRGGHEASTCTEKSNVKNGVDAQCDYCYKLGHTRGECKSSLSAYYDILSRLNTHCKRCASQYHTYEDCAARIHAISGSKVVCTRCGRLGHSVEVCQKNRHISGVQLPRRWYVMNTKRGVLLQPLR